MPTLILGAIKNLPLSVVHQKRLRRYLSRWSVFVHGLVGYPNLPMKELWLPQRETSETHTQPLHLTF